MGSINETDGNSSDNNPFIITLGIQRGQIILLIDKMKDRSVVREDFTYAYAALNILKKYIEDNGLKKYIKRNKYFIKKQASEPNNPVTNFSKQIFTLREENLEQMNNFSLSKNPA